MKPFLATACLLLLGTGCTQTPPPPPVAPLNPPQNTQSSSVDTPNEHTEASDVIETDAYTFVTPSDLMFEPGNPVRIQNFVSQDNPQYDYAEDAFFIEIFPPLDTRITEEEFATWHETTSHTTLNGKAVVMGNGQEAGGESWSGHVYFEPVSNTIINIYYNHPKGEQAAEVALQNLEWK